MRILKVLKIIGGVFTGLLSLVAGAVFIGFFTMDYLYDKLIALIALSLSILSAYATKTYRWVIIGSFIWGIILGIILTILLIPLALPPGL
jgi:hypothetical protein